MYNSGRVFKHASECHVEYSRNYMSLGVLVYEILHWNDTVHLCPYLSGMCSQMKDLIIFLRACLQAKSIVYSFLKRIRLYILLYNIFSYICIYITNIYNIYVAVLIYFYIFIWQTFVQLYILFIF